MTSVEAGSGMLPAFLKKMVYKKIDIYQVFDSLCSTNFKYSFIKKILAMHPHTFTEWLLWFVDGAM